MVKNNPVRKTTLEERLSIVEHCIEHDSNYYLTAREYNCSYAQVRSWILKYRTEGIEGLYDKRGHKKAEEELTKLEKLQAENRMLKAKAKRQQMEIEQLHEEHPDMGYHRIRDTLAHDQGIQVNDKRILHICRKKKIQSISKHRYNCCSRPASDPAYVAEKVLNHEFTAEHLNEKWVTEVTEFKYGTGTDERTGKAYLSVILDLGDHKPVSYVLSEHNDNPLLYDTFDAALAANPGTQPIFHSDRGYQYTSKVFRQKILNARMTQSMSRVAHCIDNGPMEGF